MATCSGTVTYTRHLSLKKEDKKPKGGAAAAAASSAAAGGSSGGGGGKALPTINKGSGQSLLRKQPAVATTFGGPFQRNSLLASGSSSSLPKDTEKVIIGWDDDAAGGKGRKGKKKKAGEAEATAAAAGASSSSSSSATPAGAAGGSARDNGPRLDDSDDVEEMTEDELLDILDYLGLGNGAAVQALVIEEIAADPAKVRKFRQNKSKLCLLYVFISTLSLMLSVHGVILSLQPLVLPSSVLHV
jgi:hypothetical protein